ncbi:biotin transporter BioY [Desulfococcaceae bacterium HSG7]|nr:biotin transporter BioY [Desulfococcaceae bacterium HSG7]
MTTATTETNPADTLRMTVYASLSAALIAAGAYMAIPIGPVPIVLQNFFVMLTALLLGSRWGMGAIAVYLLAGACGLPVFAGGMGGIVRFGGPTGGYLIGYLPMVLIIGLIVDKTDNRMVYDILAMILGTIILYVCGVTWLKTVTDIVTGITMTWSEAFAVGMYPFLIGDAVKIAVAAPLARSLRPLIKQFVN